MTAEIAPPLRHRGGPLVMLLLLVAGWAGLRAMWWEDPFTPSAAALTGVPTGGLAPRSLASPILISGLALPEAAYDPLAAGLPLPGEVPGPLPAARPRRLIAYAPAPALYLPGISSQPSLPPGRVQPAALARAEQAPTEAPFLPAYRPKGRPGKDKRWSLDVWTFYRQGSSGAVPVSQGRVPTYGGSQTGAVLQYRIARSSRHDPRLYLRAYRALVPNGESDLALGASVRPLPRVPVRLAAEARYTDFVTGAVVRPAAYAFTELAPIRLPLGTQLDAYAQAGWVGGQGQTAFADGQAAVTRELPFVGRMSGDAVRLSLGAGAWGGAQKGAERLDVGPTMRLDLKLGRVPARLSVDYRHRVAGDAQPGSGVSATFSTGF